MKIVSTVLISLLGLFSFAQENVKYKFNLFHSENPIEKIYASTDKQVYSIGDNVYYKLFLVNGINHTPSPISTVAYVELMNQGEVLFEQVLQVENGQANGQLFIPDTLESGRYTLRTYTEYQLNFKNQFVFSKEIEVINPSMNLNYLSVGEPKYDFQIFPEGGHIVYGKSNVIGFKSTNAKGVGVPLTGVLMANKDTLTTLVSEHKGMGKFIFTPKENIKYRIKYSIDGNEFDFKIKDIKGEGYKMTLMMRKEDVRFIVSSNSPELNFENTYIFVQTRGKPLTILFPKNNVDYIHYKIPYSQFPNGVVQLTFFKDDKPLLERIYFNKTPVFNVNIGHVKNETTTDSKISHSIQLSNDSLDLASYASVSVLQRGSKNPTINILSYLLLASDLNGTVENPNYYFENQNQKKREHLDLLMLTQGWRQHSWNDVLSEDLDLNMKIKPQSGISIRGRVKSLNTNSAVAQNLSMYIMGNYEFVHEFVSDNNGLFEINNLDVQDSVFLIIQAAKEKKKKKQLIQVVDNSVTVEIIERKKPPKFVRKILSTRNSNSSIQTSEFDLNKLENVKVLDDVVISAKRIEKDSFDRTFMLYSRPDKRLVLDSILGSLSGYTSISSLLSAKVIGLTYQNDIIQIRGSEALVILDGSVLRDVTVLDNMQPAQIEFVDVLRGPKASIYGARSVVLIYSNLDYTGQKEINTGNTVLSLSGFHKADKFYEPKYNQVANNYLTTIHWDPEVVFEDGKFNLEFKNYDLDMGYIVFVEGITKSGHPFSYQFKDN